MSEQQDLDDRFEYHVPDNDKKALHDTVRAMFKETALFVSMFATTRETSLAMTKLEEAMFWTNAHVARNIANGEFQEKI